jgi:hypothetical protein
LRVFTNYHLSLIAIGFLLIYAISFFLYKRKHIKVTAHSKIWNILLMVTFMVTGVFGLLLAIQAQYGMPFSILFNMLFWHVETGIVMTFVSFFHMAWHFKYYARILGTTRSKLREAEAAQRYPAPRTAQRGQMAYIPDRVHSLERQ